MPGNEHEDRVHNFFAQENSLQGQHHSQAVEGHWPIRNSNFWAGSHRQDNSLNSSSITYNSQNSGSDRGTGSFPNHVTYGLNLTQPNLRPDAAKSQSLNEPPNLNGFMYENQFFQSRQNETNFLGMDRNSTQHHFIPSKSLPVHELHQSGGPDHLTRAAVRPETPESPVNFDIFGRQQQRSHQPSSIPPSLQHQQSEISNMQHQQSGISMQHQQSGISNMHHQQSGISNMQHQQSGISNMQHQQSGISNMQHQLMIRKMQELQRQQHLQHLDLRQHNSNNEVDPFAKPTSSSQSSFVCGTPNSDTPQFPWAAERGPNWMDRGSPTLQGSPSGHGFPTNLGQMQRLVDLVPQDQSLYGVPISSSKGLPVNQHSRMVTARSSTPQMPTSNNHLQGSELNLLSDQVGAQNEPSISRHKLQNENMFGLAAGLNTGMRNIGGFQQVNSMSRSVLQQDFLGRQEVAVRPDTSHEKMSRHVALPQNEVALDPTEEKILFGSDDNIWDAFGNSPNVSSEVGNVYDNGRLSNGLPSNQSGRWSALMQSAVAETSSSDIVPPEEWSGLILHKNDDLPRGQPSSMPNGCSIKQTSLADENKGITSALNADSFPPANDIGTANAIGVKRFGENFQNEPGQTLPTEMTDRSVQSLEESGKRSNSGPLHHLVSERSQMRGDSLQYSLLAATSTKTNSPTWMPGQTGTGQSNGWNPQAAIRGDRVSNTHEAEKSQQNFRNSKVTMMQGDMNHRSSLWNSNSVPSSEMKLGHANSIVGNHRENQGILSSKDASVAKSCNAQMRVETNSYVQNSYLLNQWNNAHPPARSQDGGSLGRLLHQANDVNHALKSTNSHEKDEVPINEMENCDGKENSNDSHRSNLSQHTSSGFRESGLSDVSDSQSFPTGKQKSINQLSRKVPAPRKFHYHPMNLAEDADAKPTNDLKQSTRVQAISQQNAHFGLGKMFGQIPRNSTVTEKGQSSDLHRDTSGTAKEPSHGNLSGHSPNVPLPFSRATDSDAHTSNNASLSSQNMLELLHKVDQSRNDGAMMQFRSSEYNSSSRQPEAEKSDGFGHLQHSKSSVSQGFGLQLGPPSQKLQVLDHSLSSQNDQGIFSSSTSAAAGMGDKGQQMAPSRSVQPFHSAEKAQVDFGLGRSATMGPGSKDSSFYRTPESFISALHSGTPHSREIVRNQQIASVSGQMSMTQHIDSFNGNTSHPAQRKPSETLMADASSSFGRDNLAFRDDALEKLQTDSAPNSDQEKSSRKFTMPGAGISRQGNSAHYNMWTDVPKLQHNMGVQSQQVSSCNPESPLPNIVESSSASLMQGCVNSEAVANGEDIRLKESSGQPLASANTDTVTKLVKPFGKALSMNKPADDSPSSSVFKQKDIETFGQSLKPNIISHQNYISKSQMEVLKDGEIDSGHRASKRMRGPESPDNIEDVQQGALRAGQHKEHNAVVGASTGSINGPETEDCKSLGFSRPPDILQRKVSHQGDVASDDGLGLNRDVSHSLSCSDHMTSVRANHPLVSLTPQMASSWFSQFGTFSNGQMLQIYGAQQVNPLKPGETPSAKASSDLDRVNPEVRGTAAPRDEMNNDQTSSLVVNGNFTSLRSPQQNITGQHQVVLRPKKRIKASPELHPWHKEISHDSQDLWSLSMAEANWNKAANHLNEKIEDDAELMEDWHPVFRSKRRLVLTTHLMQQLLPPAPVDVICADASCSYEILAYHVSRRALGDACSMACQSSNLDAPCDNTDRHPAKGGLPERSGCLSRAKATEELMERAMKLEYDLSRLDKSAPILDLRVECQELEKFSIINRFAKFHGRGQSDNAEIASIGVNANMQKFIAQRYVTALPMPKNLPDGVQCLSL